MKFSEVEKNLVFGHNLVKVKLELQAFQLGRIGYPYDTVHKLREDLMKEYEVDFVCTDSEKPLVSIDAEKVPDKILSSMRNMKSGGEITAMLVYLGYHVGFWWQTKHHGGEILTQLNRNVEGAIEDLNSMKESVSGRLYEVISKYSNIEFDPNKTADLYRDLARAYTRPASSTIPTITPASTKLSNVEEAPIKILFLAANPNNTVRLRTDEEARAIEEQIARAQKKAQLIVVNKGAVRIGDLQYYIGSEKPTVVHFSGHGTDEGKLVFEDDMGNARAVPPMALARVFETLKKNIRIVILNACFSSEQAEAIRQHIDCVIGMSSAISDPAAIAFASAFYLANASGCSVKEAFERGITEIMLWDIPDEHVPQILCRDGVDPASIVLLK